jgi:hypothetical protein
MSVNISSEEEYYIQGLKINTNFLHLKLETYLLLQGIFGRGALSLLIHKFNLFIAKLIYSKRRQIRNKC